MLINIIEEYNVRLLSTKIYWDKPSLREAYKSFWAEYKKLDSLKDNNYDEYVKKKEILFVRNDLQKVFANENKYYKIIKFYKNKLVELGAMRALVDECYSEGNYTKGAKKVAKRRGRRPKVAV